MRSNSQNCWRDVHFKNKIEPPHQKRLKLRKPESGEFLKVAVHVVFSSLLACPNDGIILQTQPDSSRASLTTRPIQAMTSTGAGRQVRLRYEHRSYSVATLIDGESSPSIPMQSQLLVLRS
jgi:hypothetical protein